MTQKAVPSETHPADALGVALVRATGVLSALTACQDSSRGNFAVSDQFLVQAVTVLEGFVNDARNAYFDVCSNCDLSLTGPSPSRARNYSAPRQPDPIELQEEQAIFVPEPPVAVQATLPDLYAIREAIEAAPKTAPYPAGPQGMDDVATSYDDLLRKLTAAEIFASERNLSSAEQNSPLLPLLKSLRQDLERFRAA